MAAESLVPGEGAVKAFRPRSTLPVTLLMPRTNTRLSGTSKSAGGVENVVALNRGAVLQPVRAAVDDVGGVAGTGNRLFTIDDPHVSGK